MKSVQICNGNQSSNKIEGLISIEKAINLLKSNFQKYFNEYFFKTLNENILLFIGPAGRVKKPARKAPHRPSGKRFPSPLFPKGVSEGSSLLGFPFLKIE